MRGLFAKCARETLSGQHQNTKIVAGSAFCGVVCGVASGIVIGDPLIGAGIAVASTAINISINKGICAIQARWRRLDLTRKPGL